MSIWVGLSFWSFCVAADDDDASDDADDEEEEEEDDDDDDDNEGAADVDKTTMGVSSRMLLVATPSCFTVAPLEC